jgi:hypothetical protein
MNLTQPLAPLRGAFIANCRLVAAGLGAAALMTAAPAMAQTDHAGKPHTAATESVASKSVLQMHLEMARRMYEPQKTPHWKLPVLSAMTADGKPRTPWKQETFGPLSGESSHIEKGEISTDYTDEFRMYWSRIPDFHIAEYKVWPTKEGWIARIIYEGTTKDGTHVRAHQADIATVDETGKVVRFEWHCSEGEWIRQVWTRASGLTELQVRDVLSKPKGWDRLIDISLGRASAD